MKKWREVGQHAAVIWAQLFQRVVDNRLYVPPFTRPVFLWEDEAHHFTIEQDALFQATARKHGIAVVRLTQNLPNFLMPTGATASTRLTLCLATTQTSGFTAR